MKNVRLKQMKLKNFKGIKDLEVNFNGVDTIISGRNATGKTTIVDAFMWLFFNKDSNGAADFDIKPKRSNGEYIHNLDSAVEAVLNVDGTETKFMKVYKEKYTKQRGSSTATFTGHTTDYYVDDVPKKKKEYEAVVNGLFDSKYFKIITDPAYFNQKMKWQDRRKLLIDMCGDVSDEDVIASNADLMPLMMAKGNKTIEDYRLQVRSQMKPINEELKAIPIKINEAQLAIPKDIESVDEDKIKYLESQVDSLNAKKQAIINGGGKVEKEAELIRLNNSKLILENEVPDTKKLKNDIYDAEFKIDSLNRKKDMIQNHIASRMQMIEQNEATRNHLRKKFIEVKNKEFDESKVVCPTCGQVLPEDKIHDLVEKFNIDKSNQLENINKRGVTLKEECDDYMKKNLEDSAELENIDHEFDALKKVVAESKEKMEKVTNEFQASQKVKIAKVTAEIEKVKAEIVENDNTEAINVVNEQLNELKEELARLNKIKAQQDFIIVQEKRITELEVREKQLADEYSRLDQMLYLTDLFVKTKVSMLTERINSRFELCNFKLFDVQINGGIEECCEVTVNGVSYSDLNNAMKINAGLDVINAVCKYADTQVPIFIDNCEAVNQPIRTESQQIRLYVTDVDNLLRIEHL